MILSVTTPNLSAVSGIRLISMLFSAGGQLLWPKLSSTCRSKFVGSGSNHPLTVLVRSSERKYPGARMPLGVFARSEILILL